MYSAFLLIVFLSSGCCLGCPRCRYDLQQHEQQGQPEIYIVPPERERPTPQYIPEVFRGVTEQVGPRRITENSRRLE